MNRNKLKKLLFFKDYVYSGFEIKNIFYEVQYLKSKAVLKTQNIFINKYVIDIHILFIRGIYATSTTMEDEH